ncbi:MAG: tRNA (adenosine(37)-N6)-threonylcarbamoyltransferase complex dimerization subunit type 1 TsaB [Dehalococcoidales bacterium]|nr:tRNA (adenosine(37)-N6)-threonylcarbamoyltransferase complex dimerization subunit type 1 TsaB [Dehalococcoidales bacterium]
MILAIDTATDVASLALIREEIVLAEFTWRTEQNHTTEVLPSLAKLFELTKSGPQSLTAVIVGKGPGSFNGLRVGISIAKGLAFSLGIPIIGINSLESAAYQYAETGLPVCPVFNAGRNEVATATYRKMRGKWRQLVAEHITTVEKLCSETKIKTLFCGEHTPAIGEKITALLKGKAVIASTTTDLKRSGFLAELGMQRLAAGDSDNPATLQPIYLRRPPITEKKRP